jgi:hypothetical protein
MTDQDDERRPAGNGAADTTTGEVGLRGTVAPVADILRRRRHSKALDKLLGRYRGRRPEPYSGGNGTELDVEQRAAAAA